MHVGLSENDLLNIELRNKGNRDVEALIDALWTLREEMSEAKAEWCRTCSTCLDNPER
jgi:hypothetical protein